MPTKSTAPTLISLRDAAEKRSGETLASATYQRLREDIINSVHAPGTRLRIQELCDRYNVGPSPVREALNRLTRDDLVVLSDHKGFSVTPLSRAHLEELTRTRCLLVELALREAIRLGDAAWEEGVILAYHRLSRSPRDPEREPSTGGAFNSVWEQAHRAFHSSLIAACGSRWIIDFCEQLFDAADRYRHLSRTAGARPAQRRDEHREMMDAVVARDADKAVTLLNRHFMRTCERVKTRLPSLDGPA